MSSPLIRYGDIVLDRMLIHEPEMGGTLALVFGPQGSAKTTLLINIAEALMLSGEYVIWRGMQLAQWHRFKDWKKKINLIFHKDDKPRFFVVKHGSEEAGEIFLQYTTYEMACDILELIRNDKINVVYEPTHYTPSLHSEIMMILSNLEEKYEKENRKITVESRFFWFELIDELIHRIDRRWIALVIDEIDDLFPPGAVGAHWHLLNWLRGRIQNARKSFVSIFGATHAKSNVDYRIYEKFQMRIYGRGARIPKDSLFKPRTLTSKLKLGEFLIEEGAFYGKITTEKLPKRDYDIVVKFER